MKKNKSNQARIKMYADLKTRLNEPAYSADDEASESSDEKKQKMEVTRRKRPYVYMYPLSFSLTSLTMNPYS